MCGRRHQRRGYGACGMGGQPRQAYGSTGGVADIISAVQQMRLGEQTIQSQQRSVPEMRGQQQTNGVIYERPSSIINEKTPEGQFQYEELPTYNESVGEEETAARYPTSDNKQVIETARSMGRDVVPQISQSTGTASQNVLAAGLVQFQSALATYKEGGFGGRRQAKRAARNLVYEMYAAEMARRQADHGRLQCGERKQIKRDLRPVKQMLKNTVWEARSQRTGCC